MTDDKEILEMIKEIGAVAREEEKKIESANNIIKRMEEGAGKDILKATLGASEDTLIKYKRLAGWLAELRMRRNVEKWTCVEDGTIPREEPCEYCVSRQAVLDKLNRLIEVERLQGTDEMGYGRERVSAYESMIFEVNSEYLYPSVTPQPKTGHWITLKDEYGDIHEAVCSCCDKNGNHKWAYCPNCGAKMVESEDNE